MSRRFALKGKLGRGAFGEVFAARDELTGAVVALKRVRLRNVREGIPAAAFREMRALLELDHGNVVRLLDVHADGSHMVLVFEFMRGDLNSFLAAQRRPLPEAIAKALLRMLLQGLAFCHSQGVMHRDLKPHNLLLAADGTLKIADFGLARVVGVEGQRYTHQVATRWYRAPELLFGAQLYTSAVDLWAVGAIFAELLVGTPLFPGEHDIDQVYRVVQVLGTPSEANWPGVNELPDFSKVSFAEMPPLEWRGLVPDASDEALALLQALLVYDPAARLTAAEALRHPFFFVDPLPATAEEVAAQWPSAPSHAAPKKTDFSFLEDLDSSDCQ